MPYLERSYCQFQIAYHHHWIVVALGRVDELPVPVREVLVSGELVARWTWGDERERQERDYGMSAVMSYGNKGKEIRSKGRLVTGVVVHE